MRKSVAPSLDLSQAIRYIFTCLSMTRYIWRRAFGVVHLQPGPSSTTPARGRHDLPPTVCIQWRAYYAKSMYKQAVSGL